MVLSIINKNLKNLGFSIMTLTTIAFSIMTFSIIILSIMTFSVMTLSIITLSIITNKNYFKHNNTWHKCTQYNVLFC
jgi:hypothetical protein